MLASVFCWVFCFVFFYDSASLGSMQLLGIHASINKKSIGPQP